MESREAHTSGSLAAAAGGIAEDKPDHLMKTGIKRKTIIHCDMDAFYAGVEALDNPSLKGKPVIVGGNRERGVVSASSYEARRFGIHSAQPMAEAMRRCPNGIFLPVRMSRYKEVSCRVFDIFYRFTPVVEPLSIDEAFLDVTDSTRLFGDAEAIAKRIKTMVREEIGLTVSAGVAPLKFVAKIASDLNKPDGLIVVSPEQVKTFLEPLPIERLWGVGAASRKRLSILGVNTIGDLSRIPPEILEAKFGKQGMHLHLLSLGIDERDVETDHQTKSIGREETYSEDIMDVEEIRKELLSLAMKVAGRLRRNRCTGKVLTLKVKYYDFVLITRAMTLPAATDDGKYIFEHCCRLLEKTEAGKRPVRLLGISLSRLATPEEERQRSLFENDAAPEPRKKLNRALDIIEEKFGEDSLIPGTLLKK